MSTSLHAALAGGANLGGITPGSNDFGIPPVAGVTTAPTQPTAVAGANGAAGAPAGAATTGGGDTQAAQGAANLNVEQLVPVLQQVVAAVNALVAALQAQGGVAGTAGEAATTSGGGAAGGCGMAGCSMDHGSGSAGVEQASAGANGAPKAAGAEDATQGARKKKKSGGASGGATQSFASTGNAGQAPQSYSGRTPRKLSGETSYSGLNEKSFRVLEAAHAHGLKLISGHRPGDTGSGHSNGSAVDVANVPGGSRQGSPEMRAYAEQIRAAGKAGDPNIGYVIYQQQIASARNNWAWRDMEDRGSNTQNHFDHVHVSTDPNL